jgi:hypothetical protein
VIKFRWLTVAILLWGLLFPTLNAQASDADKAVPLIIGETFTINSKILSETRRINIYVPPAPPRTRTIKRSRRAWEAPRRSGSSSATS